MNLTRSISSGRKITSLILHALLCSGIFAQDIKPENKANKISRIAEELAKSNVLKQLQYEVDMSNGLLWIRTGEFLGDDYILTRGSLGKEAILDFIQGKAISSPPTTMGYAMVAGKTYVIDLNTKTWIAAPINLPHLDVGMFDYLTVGSSYDFQYAIENLKSQGESLKADSESITKETLANQLRGLLKTGSDAYSFSRGKYLISVKSEKNGMIREWEVTNDGVLVRKIVNNILPETKLSIEALPVAEGTGQIALEQTMTDLFKAQGKTPSLGVFLVPSINGDYVITYVCKGSSADRAEVHVNDVVTHVNGVKIKSFSFDKVRQLLAERPKVTLTILTHAGNTQEKVIMKEVLPSGH